MNGVHLQQRSYGCEADAHCHEFHQILLPVSGALELEVDGVAGRVESSRAGLIAAASPHAFRGVGSNRLLVLDVPASALDEARHERLLREPFAAVDRGLGRQIRFVQQGLERRSLSTAVLRHWSAHVLELLTARPDLRHPPLPAAVLRALGFLDDAYPEPVSVTDVARAARVSPSHLRALFRCHLGESVQQRLTAVRLDAALRLLAEGSESIAAIALAVGFSDQTALTRALRRERAITPAAYRRRLRRSERAADG
jgi:AraC-like DNA-binding protein